MKETFEGFIKWMIGEDQELFLECLSECKNLIEEIVEAEIEKKTVYTKEDFEDLQKEIDDLKNENAGLQDLETVHRMICTDRLQDAIDLISEICNERFMSIEQFKRMGLK